MSPQESLASIFKLYDVRGKVGSQLTPDLLYKIGAVFGSWLPAKGIVAVGRDMRPDSEELASSLIKGLQSQGRDVWDIGKVTSDMIYFAAGQYKLAGGSIVTASHNPGQDNGIKFVADQAKAVGLESGLDQIRDAVLASHLQPSNSPGQVIPKDISKDWIKHTLSFIDISKLKPLKIAVDAGNGMAGKIFPLLEPYVPFEVTEMYFELDGSFPNHEANPLKFETLHDIIDVIKNKQLDAGIAFDGDGDRAFLIDEQGQVLTGAVMSSMLAEYFLEKHPGEKIVYDVRNSKSVPELVTELGGTPIKCRVGHTPIKHAMRKSGAVFGGEASGHYYFRDNWYADSGLIGAVVALYVLSTSGQKLSDIRKKYIKYAAIPETNFEVVNKEAVTDQLKKLFSSEEHEEIDGVTVNLKDGSWFNVRPSNTEPLLRLNAEAKTQAELDKLVAKVKSVINS